eukprot:Nitzschia sp. Nitz4//scaffold3_size479765//404373//405532//NITZ4_000173-RA/size479765-augustus-gene-1.583-mRNA-1//1//CDS//3329550977//2501//frame0
MTRHALFLLGILGLIGLPFIASAGHIRSRELSGVLTSTSETSTCRCEYPGEELYDADGAVISTSITGDLVASTSYAMDGETIVLPSTHDACSELWFVCPGVNFTGTPWSYECPSENENGSRRLDTGSTRVYYTQEAESINDLPEEIHSLIDEDGSESLYYVVLPNTTDFCLNGGTSILSGEDPDYGCKAETLSFNKAGDRRPLPSGSSVGGEWFRTLGLKISASSDGGVDNIQPIIVDLSSQLSSSTIPSDVYKALGSHSELSNVLVPLRLEGLEGDVNDHGMLTFTFSKDTTVNSITVLNASDYSKLFIIQADGTRTIKQLDSVGNGMKQTITLEKEKVVRLSVVFKSIGAVTGMDLCFT